MSLSLGGTQLAVLIVFVLIVVALISVFVLVARRARAPVPYEAVTERGYALRRVWLAALVAILSLAVGGSLLLLPYSGAADANITVRASGGQFYWSLSPETVPAGSVVRFEVTSVDVNHGFGVYHPDGYVIGNVQAMPGVTNNLILELNDPGSYLISCLEFCGARHHEMAREFEVVEEPTAAEAG